jgi:hypothetical protein
MTLKKNTSNQTSFANPVQGLEQVLQQQLELYSDYMTHLNADVNLMSKLHIDELEKNNKAKTTLLLKIQTMDQARQNLVKQIAKANNLKEEQITIEDICKTLSTETSQRLLQLRTKLQNLIQELKLVQANASNLANASLVWINSSMSTLKQLLTPSATYNPQGQVGEPGMFSGRTVERQV